ncbi:MAG: sigma-70 family RNA polymerase sigma factor [Polyangiaceae bacterium]|nr:sigma-70 family RNA polymerase sigma factor [Polyangiaceae bacterium]
MDRDTQPPQGNDDLELVAGLLRNEESSWREFHVRYDRLIQRCIRKVTHAFAAIVRGEDEREIHGNLVLSLLANDKRKLRRYDPARGSRFGTWLGLLATNAAYDYLRCARRELPKVPLSEAECTPCTDDVASPFDLIERKQQSRLVAELLDQLSAKDRAFVALYFARGLSPEVVASELRISIKTVYSKKHKIQTRLESLSSQRLAA